jgi:flagellar basal body-associated protein FliL
VKEPSANGVIIFVIVGIAVVTIFVVFIIYMLLCNKSAKPERETAVVKEYSTSEIIMKN